MLYLIRYTLYNELIIDLADIINRLFIHIILIDLLRDRNSLIDAIIATGSSLRYRTSDFIIKIRSIEVYFKACPIHGHITKYKEIHYNSSVERTCLLCFEEKHRYIPNCILAMTYQHAYDIIKYHF
jgi:hypothetical protein